MTQSREDRIGILIRVESGPASGATATVHAGQAVIGRDADACDLALPDDATVSRRHAALSFEGGRWLLRDLGSKNGTFLPAPDGPQPVETATPIPLGGQFLVGSALVSLHPLPVEAPPGVQLRVLRVGDVLHFSLETGAAVATAAQHPCDDTALAAAQRRLLELIHDVQHTGQEIEEHFRLACIHLSGLLLPRAISAALAALPGVPLTLVLEPGLIGLPWEALHDGTDFLCATRPLSRVVLLDATPRAHGMGKNRILIIANPTGDLPLAQEHGESIFEWLHAELEWPEVRFLAARRATVEHVAAALEQADAAIYLGHARHDPAAPAQSGWCLADGLLTPEHFRRLGAVPPLVIAAACESARETPAAKGYTLLPEGTGIAAALLLAGVSQYVGALWPIPVVSGTAFGTVLLRGVLEGVPLGQAVLHARAALRDTLHAPAHAYAALAHYGSPNWRWQRP